MIVREKRISSMPEIKLRIKYKDFTIGSTGFTDKTSCP